MTLLFDIWSSEYAFSRYTMQCCFSVPHTHAREPLYSNSAVIAWCSQSTGAQNILFWFTVINSMSQFFTTFNFHDVFFIWNYCLDIVVHSGPIRAFRFKNQQSTSQFLASQWDFMCLKCVQWLINVPLKSSIIMLCHAFSRYTMQCCFSVPHTHAREPLYSNNAVIAWCSQWTGAQNILFWFTVINSMSQFFTTFNFHDVFFIWNYCLDIVVHSGPIRAFRFKNQQSTSQFLASQWDFMCLKFVQWLINVPLKSSIIMLCHQIIKNTYKSRTRKF